MREREKARKIKRGKKGATDKQIDAMRKEAQGKKYMGWVGEEK